MVSGTEHVEGVYLGVVRRIARLADGIAEVEDVRISQSSVRCSQYGYLKPLLLDDVVVTGPEGGPWTVEFTQTYANDNVELMTSSGVYARTVGSGIWAALATSRATGGASK